MTVVIDSGSQLTDTLQRAGLKVAAYTPDAVASLTALLFDDDAIENIVVAENAILSWSTGHILAAAKYLQSKGRLVFFGDCTAPSALVSVARDDRELIQLLQSKPVKPSKNAAGGQLLTPKETQRTSAPAPIRPLTIPAGKILILGVIGSQHRIGCTTQAIGLWHYCKALGFDPAVVASPAQIAQIAATMHTEEISGGYRIEGVPLVSNMALSYDCYVVDMGTSTMREALKACDDLVLVAGSKPWELQHTAAALRGTKGRQIHILLSFSSMEDAKQLQPLFGAQSVGVLPWMPTLWSAVPAALEIYDILLRPALEQFLAKEEPVQEYTKEE